MYLFDIAKSTAREIVEEVCNAFIRKLFQKDIAIPSRKTVVSIIQGFAGDWGFPQCVGALGGCHILILAPQDRPKDYFNHKVHNLILLQGLVHHNYCFMDINVGWPGSVHETWVLANSKLYQKGERGELFPHIAKEISGVLCPLLFSVILPIHYCNGSRNCTLMIEDSPGNCQCLTAVSAVLKGRWRCLLKRSDTHISRMPTVITVCAMLHNICELHRDEFNHDWIEDT